MKITDYALVFVGITLPFILIAYINIALTIRTFQQEMYYQKMIDAAVEDTMNQMKYVESSELTNDYGYSGEIDNKLSNNPQIAVDTFFNSMYGSLNILDDEASQSIIQVYVPVIAIMDYNGVYISSIEETEEGEKHVLKPKRYFAFEYAVDNRGDAYVAKSDGWHLLKYDEEKKEFQISENGIQRRKSEFYVFHNIEFTTDDRIYHTIYDNVNQTSYGTLNYYITDNTYDPRIDKNVLNMSKSSIDNIYYAPFETSEISPIYYGMVLKSDSNEVKDKKKALIKEFASFLQTYKKSIMTEIIVDELSYAANKNNEYARKKGISYNFSFSLDKNDTMYNDIENMGVLALVQGIKVGNRYLNYKAYNYSDLEVAHKYYLSTGEKKNDAGSTGSNVISEDEANSLRFGAKLKLYHKTEDCIEYLSDITFDDRSDNNYKNVAPTQKYTYTKEAAASMGYYPCPICNP